ncbi:MAG: citrate lyase subunit beta / citryl-CoA lyase [Paenibacillus sp.]|jgi:citrate lyase subunit beta/citryl-CoA lyase|nr:citrate lyase subunit beta / citryl-CoA lyase [Paenibacillus sp.]
MEQVYLFSPGDSRKKLDKAIGSGADVVIIDLEDGVAAEDKEQARHVVRTLLDEIRDRSNGRPRIMLRINPVSSVYFVDDMPLLQDERIEGVMIPKCEGAADIRSVAESNPNIDLIPLIESVAGVRYLEAIASADRRVRRVAFGAVDYALDLGAEWSACGDERKFAMGQLVFMSRALGMDPPIDAVFPVTKDKAALQVDTEYGRKVGFYGKMIIHPGQIEWVREVYRVTAEQLEWSTKVVHAYEQRSGVGSMELEGKLIDLPIYKKAKRIVESSNNHR